MRRLGIERLIGAAIACIAACAPVRPAAAAGSELRIEWVKEYGADAGWLELEAAALRKTDLVLAVNAHVPNSDVNRHSLMRVGHDGSELGRVEVPPSYVMVRALAVGGTGEQLFSAADAPVDRPWLLRLAPTLAVEAEQKLTAGNELTVLCLVPAAGGRFLVAGHAMSRGVATIVEAGGNQPWPEKRIEPPVGMVRDGVGAADGGFVLIGNEVNADGAPTSVWIGRTDAAGNVVKQRTIPGRHGRIVRATAPGAYAVLYDESATQAQKIRLRVLNADLGDVSTTAVLDVGEGYQEFELGTWSGGFLVAGGRNDRPWFAAVSADGKLGTPVWAETMSPSEKYELVAADEAGFVASSVFVEFTDAAGKRQATQKVRVIKLGRNAA